MKRPFGLIVLLVLAAATLLGCGGGNQAPSVEITRPQNNQTIQGKAVAFQARGADEDLPQGQRLTYEWDFGDGQTGSGAQVRHTYEKPGTYTVTVMATDERGAKSEAAAIKITVENAPPQGAISAHPTSGQAPLNVQFDGRGSQDADGDIARYEWDFGDGQTGSGAQVTHEYAQSGRYEVTLIVTDGDGATASATTTITAEAGMAEQPSGMTHEVRMVSTGDGRQIFEPALVRVQPGDTVRWVLASGVHTTTAYSKENGKAQGIPESAPSWDSGIIAEQDAAYEVTFPEDAPTGTYAYFCIPHEAVGMVGLVVVGEFTPLGEEFLTSLPGRARSEMQRLIVEARQEDGGGM